MKVNKLGLVLMALVAAVAYPLSGHGKSNQNPKTVVLTSDNTVSLAGEINPDSVTNIINEFRKLDAKASSFGQQKPIYLFMYTPGGEIQSGLELIEAAKGMRRPINTITLFSASMGWQTVQALGERLILKNGTLMSHRAAGGFEGYFGGKAPSQVDSRYAYWLQRIKELDIQTVERTKGKQTLESYREQYQNETWLTGSQAVELGYADEVVTVRCDDSLSGTSSHQINFLGLDIHYETSKCPLITAITNVTVAGATKEGFTSVGLTVREVKEKFLSQFKFSEAVQ